MPLGYKRQDMLDAYSCGNLTPFSTLQNLSLSLYLIENVASSKYALLDYPSYGHTSCLTPISFKA